MPTKKRRPYPGCEKGGAFGYLGKPKDAYTEDDLHDLGKELIAYMNEPRNVWAKGFCNRKGLSPDHIKYLNETYPLFKSYYLQAKAIQEEKLVMHSFWKEGDGNFAKFMLARHHEGWEEEKQEINQQYTYNVNYGNPIEVPSKTLSDTNSKRFK
jgi:hypothetical protein